MYTHMNYTLIQPENKALFLDFFGSSFGSGFESRSETFISVPDRIRIQPEVSDPSGSGSGSGSGSATLAQIVFIFAFQELLVKKTIYQLLMMSIRFLLFSIL